MHTGKFHLQVGYQTVQRVERSGQTVSWISCSVCTITTTVNLGSCHTCHLRIVSSNSWDPGKIIDAFVESRGACSEHILALVPLEKFLVKKSQPVEPNIHWPMFPMRSMLISRSQELAVQATGLFWSKWFSRLTVNSEMNYVAREDWEWFNMLC